MCKINVLAPVCSKFGLKSYNSAEHDDKISYEGRNDRIMD